jgi:hypothetical protein
MKFLLFSVSVIAALVILANQEGGNTVKISGGLKSMSEKVRSEVAAIVESSSDNNVKAVIKASKVSSAVQQKRGGTNLGAPLSLPTSKPLHSVTSPETKTISSEEKSKDEKTRTPPSALPILSDPIQIKSVSAKPVVQNKTNKIRLAEGDLMMTQKQRRRELNALARDMENLFLDKVVK